MQSRLFVVWSIHTLVFFPIFFLLCCFNDSPYINIVTLCCYDYSFWYSFCYSFCLILKSLHCCIYAFFTVSWFLFLLIFLTHRNGLCHLSGVRTIHNQSLVSKSFLVLLIWIFLTFSLISVGLMVSASNIPIWFSFLFLLSVWFFLDWAIILFLAFLFFHNETFFFTKYHSWL